MEEYTHEQILAVQEYAKGLKECFVNKMKDNDPLTQIYMNYALQILDIHLELAQIKFERYSFNQEMAVKNG